MTTCYHCSQPVGDHYIVDAPGIAFHMECYLAAAESCSECGGGGSDVLVPSMASGLLGLHTACVPDRARRLAAR